MAKGAAQVAVAGARSGSGTPSPTLVAMLLTGELPTGVDR